MHMQKLIAPVMGSVACLALFFVLVVIVPLVVSEGSFLAAPGEMFESYMLSFGAFGQFVLVMCIIACVCQCFRGIFTVMEGNYRRIVFPWQPEFKEMLKRREQIMREMANKKREQASGKDTRDSGAGLGVRDTEPLIAKPMRGAGELERRAPRQTV